MVPATLTVALVFAAVHLFAGKLTFLSLLPRSRWLSAAGGVGVAYVFIHVLPELAAMQNEVGEALERRNWLVLIESHVYVLALVGLVIFFGLDRLASQPEHDRGEEHPYPALFWLHIAIFAAYNALLGFLVTHRETSGVRSLVIYTLAVGLHFVTNDFALHQTFPRRYRRKGRWVLAGAVLIGWAIGVFAPTPSRLLVGGLFGLLAGGITLNTLKEELPEERESSFPAFLIGAVAFGVLLLLI